MNIYINQLKESILDRINYFTSAVDQLILTTSASKEIKNYISEFLKLIDKNIKNLETFIHLDDQALNDSIVNSFKTLHKFFWYIHTFFDIIEQSEKLAANSPFISYAKDYFNELFIDSELIFLPYEGYNYSIQSLTDNIKQIIPHYKFEKEIILTQIPKLEKNNIFNHVLIGHEIGHRIFYRNQLIDKYLTFINRNTFNKKIENKISQLFKDLYERITPPLFVDQQQKVLRSKLETITRNWLEEITCDMIGLALFGPSFFFATINFSPFLTDFKTCSETHPPLWLRMHALTRFMSKDLNFLQYENNFVNTYTIENYNFWSDISQKYYDRYIQNPNFTEIYDYVFDFCSNAYLDVLYKLVLEATGDRTFNFGDINIIKMFSFYLENNVPPIECEDKFIHDRISPLVYIINAGWDVYKTSFEKYKNNSVDISKGNGDEIAKTNLTNLLTKSLSLSLLKKRWKNINVS